tara:strand:+ start:339 stop:563 length:225 start_codon:yes stop_codon:yes gene_type:complete
MKLWEYRIKQYTFDLEEKKIQERSRYNYEVEEILSDFGKEGYELINVISEPIMLDSTNISSKYLRTFFLKKERI